MEFLQHWVFGKWTSVIKAFFELRYDFGENWVTHFVCSCILCWSFTSAFERMFCKHSFDFYKQKHNSTKNWSVDSRSFQEQLISLVRWTFRSILESRKGTIFSPILFHFLQVGPVCWKKDDSLITFLWSASTTLCSLLSTLGVIKRRTSTHEL